MANVATNLRQAATGASEAAGQLGAMAANEERFAANMAATKGTELFKDATKKSFVSSLLSSWGMLSTVLAMPFLIKGPMGLLGKIKPLAGITGKASGLMDVMHTPVGQATQKLGEVLPGHALSRAVENHGGRVAAYAQKTWGNSKIGGAALSNIKDVSVANVALNSGFAISQVASVTMSIGDKIHTIQQMQMDLTGQKPSYMSVLAGGGALHPLVKKARGEALGGKSLTSMALQIGSAAGNIYLAFFDKSTGMKAMGKAAIVNAAPGMISRVLTSSDTVLQSYKAMTLSMAQSGKADVSLYEGLLGGMIKTGSGEMIRQMAEKAYVQQLRPAEMLKLVETMTDPKTKSFAATELARTAGKASVQNASKPIEAAPGERSTNYGANILAKRASAALGDNVRSNA